MTTELYQFLEHHQIRYQLFEHPAVFTVQDSEKLNLQIEGGKTKNLFLRDAKGKKHFLVTLEASKSADLKALAKQMNCSRLGFASAERLQHHLGVAPGSVSLLALVHDQQHQVEVWIDQDLWKEQFVLCHPMTNTSTLQIPLSDMEQFFKKTGHNFQLVKLKAQQPPAIEGTI